MGEAGQKYRVRNANERDRVRGGGGDVKEWNVAPSPPSFREWTASPLSGFVDKARKNIRDAIISKGTPHWSFLMTAAVPTLPRYLLHKATISPPFFQLAKFYFPPLPTVWKIYYSTIRGFPVQSDSFLRLILMQETLRNETYSNSPKFELLDFTRENSTRSCCRKKNFYYFYLLETRANIFLIFDRFMREKSDGVNGTLASPHRALHEACLLNT